MVVDGGDGGMGGTHGAVHYGGQTIAEGSGAGAGGDDAATRQEEAGHFDVDDKKEGADAVERARERAYLRSELARSSSTYSACV